MLRATDFGLVVYLSGYPDQLATMADVLLQKCASAVSEQAYGGRIDSQCDGIQINGYVKAWGRGGILSIGIPMVLLRSATELAHMSWLQRKTANEKLLGT